MHLTTFKQSRLEVFVHCTRDTLNLVVPLDLLYSNITFALSNANVITSNSHVQDNNIITIDISKNPHNSILLDDLYHWLRDENSIRVSNCFIVDKKYISHLQGDNCEPIKIGAYIKDTEEYYYEVIYVNDQNVYTSHIPSTLDVLECDIFYKIISEN